VALSGYQEQTFDALEVARRERDSGSAWQTPSDARCRVTDPRSAGSPWVRWMSVGGVAGLATFVAIVLALHGLRGNLNPARHTISEYSWGRDGWLMRGAFAALGFGVLATVADLRLRFAFSTRGRGGTVLLVGTALGLFLDSAYNTDHPGVAETAGGRMHGIGMLLVSLTLPAACVVLGSALLHVPGARSRARWIQVLGSAQVIATLGFEFSPTVSRGLVERMAVALAVAGLALVQSVARPPTEGARDPSARSAP
jgi:hypothetical protein